MKSILLRVLFTALVLLPATAGADAGKALDASELASNVKLNAIYGDGMVLQRNRPIVIVGQADPEKQVELVFDGERTTARADAGGRFVAQFAARKAGGPFTLEVHSSGGVQEVTDILVGEVWLGSGQSNMEWTVERSMNFAEEKAAANYPQIRHYKVKHAASAGTVAEDLAHKGSWQAATPESVGGFSAVLYFFARELQQELGVPVGIINSSWGGTAIEPWISAQAYREAGLSELATQAESSLDPSALAALREQFASDFSAWEAQLNRLHATQVAAAADWMQPDLDVSDWREVELPALYDAIGIDGNGVVWFRKSVTVPAQWLGKDLILSLGAIDDCDETYFNGERVGSTGTDVPSYWQHQRAYRIPASLVHEGENVIAVRVTDHAYGGGMVGAAAAMALYPVGQDGEAQKLPLAGPWLAKTEFLIDWATTPTRPSPLVSSGEGHRWPAGLYNAMIAPLESYPVQGVLWYQGESNAGNPAGYARVFPLLIESWRKQRKDENLSFIFAQLAAFQRHKPNDPLPKDFFADRLPGDEKWPELREAQTAALNLPNTGMAVCIDIGDPDDIHPQNKQDVGYRMAQEALRITYGRDSVSAGPLYRGMEVEGDAIRIHFNNAGSGLVAKDGALRHFAIAGEDGTFVWAEATIDGDSVLVRSDAVATPKAVRYAWANYPLGANLFNAEGFPASPFRTDVPDYILQYSVFENRVCP